MARHRALKIAAGIVVSFAGLFGVIVLLSRTRVISVAMALLMVAALLGLYVGFGVLIAIYRLTSRLK